MKRLSVLLSTATLAAALSLSGCGDEPSSVAKVPTFKKGGNIRFVNMSDAQLDGHVDDQQAATSLGTSKVAGPRLTALGEHEIRVSAGGVEWSEKIQLESEQTMTLYAYGSKPEFVMIEGDPITPPPGESLIRAVNVTGGDKVIFTLSGGGSDKSLGEVAHGSGGDTASVSAGSYTVTAKIGDKVLATAEMSVAADQTHTIVLAMQGGKASMLVIHNNPLMIPTQSGASGA